MRQRVPGLHSAHYLRKGLFLSKHAMKVACISPFNHLKCINRCLIIIALRISSVTLLCKLQNATEKVVFRTNASSQKSVKVLPYGMSLAFVESLAT